jgi:FkbM family methyltransferase
METELLGMQYDLIYDVGAHKGEDSEFYLLKGFRVIAIEAVPELCEDIRSRLQLYLQSGQLTLISAAIAERASPVKFFVNRGNSVWGTTCENWAKRNERLGAPSRMITVDGISFSEVLLKHGIPYYLKVDIEGSDLLCLRALSAFASKPKYASIETATRRWADVLEEFSTFQSLGYSRFKLVQQEHVSKQRCPNPPVEGSYVDYQFEYGATGLFGEESPGRWMSEREALRAYKSIFLRHHLFGQESIIQRAKFGRYLCDRYLSRLPLCNLGWYDTHATI